MTFRTADFEEITPDILKKSSHFVKLPHAFSKDSLEGDLVLFKLSKNLYIIEKIRSQNRVVSYDLRNVHSGKLFFGLQLHSPHQCQ